MKINVSEGTLLDYEFNNKELLITALTHSSYVNEHAGCVSNERLEFLGDSVLGLVTAENLYRVYSTCGEGALSKMRASIVKEGSLYEFALDLGVDKVIRLGNSELNKSIPEKKALLSDAFEALLGAVYLDGGFEEARKWLSRIISQDIYHDAINRNDDYKTRLQEMIPHAGKIEYRILNQTGPMHATTFEVGIFVGGKLVATGVAGNKKGAEQNAAKAAIEKLEVKACF